MEIEKGMVITTLKGRAKREFNAVSSLVFSPDGRTLGAEASGVPFLWDVNILIDEKRGSK